jgi:hypothetical protein
LLKQLTITRRIVIAPIPSDGHTFSQEQSACHYKKLTAAGVSAPNRWEIRERQTK